MIGDVATTIPDPGPVIAEPASDLELHRTQAAIVRRKFFCHFFPLRRCFLNVHLSYMRIAGNKHIGTVMTDTKR